MIPAFCKEIPSHSLDRKLENSDFKVSVIGRLTRLTHRCNYKNVNKGFNFRASALLEQYI